MYTNCVQGFVGGIEQLVEANTNFRQVVYTAKHSQLVLMAIPVGGEIGEEVHEQVDQFFRFENGEGKAVIDGVEHSISAGWVVIIPAGTKHNIINTSANMPLRLYTLYSPPNHRDKVVHLTREQAEADTEHFDGQTTE